MADEETRNHFENRKKFRPSTFARIYDSSFVKEELKFSFNKNGEFLCKTDQAEFAKAWSKVSSALANDDLNSRNFNNLESQKKWWNENFPTELIPTTELPRAVKLGSFDGIKEKMAQNSGGGEAKAAAKKAVKKSRKSPTKLIPPNFPEFEDFDVRVSALIVELKGLNYIQFANVAALGLRCLWDLSLAAYFERNGRHGKFVNFAMAEAKSKPKNAAKRIDPSLFKSPDSSQYVGAIIKNPALFDLNDQFGRSLSTHKANNVFVSLNQMVHNTKYAADPQEVQSIWTKLDLLIRRLASGEEQSK